LRVLKTAGLSIIITAILMPLALACAEWLRMRAAMRANPSAGLAAASTTTTPAQLIGTFVVLFAMVFIIGWRLLRQA
jgi:hypothetical protein